MRTGTPASLRPGRLADGGACFAALTTSFSLQQYRGPGLELFGTEGTIYLLGDDWDPDGYELCDE